MSKSALDKIAERERELKYTRSEYNAVNSDYCDSEENFQRRLNNVYSIVNRLREEVLQKEQQILRELDLAEEMKINREDPDNRRATIKAKEQRLEKEIKVLHVLKLREELAKLTEGIEC